MGNFFDDTMQGLLEAIQIEKGNISLIQMEDMPAPTFTVADKVTINHLAQAKERC